MAAAMRAFEDLPEALPIDMQEDVDDEPLPAKAPAAKPKPAPIAPITKVQPARPAPISPPATVAPPKPQLDLSGVAVGVKVKHKAFGAGIISQLEKGTLTVAFGKAEKRFIFPDAFVNRFLAIEAKGK